MFANEYIKNCQRLISMLKRSNCRNSRIICFYYFAFISLFIYFDIVKIRVTIAVSVRVNCVYDLSKLFEASKALFTRR